MITLGPLKDREKVHKFFTENGLPFDAASGCVTAVAGNEVLGFCLYEMDKSGMTVKCLSPKDDRMLADGILRSTLHVAVENGITDAFYEEEVEELCRRLGFIKEQEEKQLDIQKLFKSCHDE